jgi:hypothetical protein
MSRNVILDQYYTFNPTTRTIVINKVIPRERMILITNVTTNTVIYNFSDNSLTATSYTITSDSTGQNNYTTIVLNYNTVAMSSSDKLQIITDTFDQSFTPSETLTDPVNKFRISQPQALIDTDFEYGSQSTKWESLALINNRPFAYYTNTTQTYTDITATNGSRTVLVSTSTPPTLGSVVYIQDTIWAGADGLYVVDAVVASTSFSYTAKYTYTGTTGSINNAGVTAIYTGKQFANAQIGIANIDLVSSNLLVVTTSVPHGLSLGNEIAITGANATTPPNGSWTVTTVPNATAFTTYVASAPASYVKTSNLLTITTTANSVTATCSATANAFTGQYIQPTTGIPFGTYITGNVTNTSITLSNPANASASNTVVTATANMFVRPPGLTVHRAFDGGVQFSTNAQSHNQQYVRQTRRYFRYQSGKGIQMSTGTIMKPNFNVDSLTANALTAGSTATVVTKQAHNVNPGVSITISGANETGYNGTFTVAAVKDAYTFTYTLSAAVTATTASGPVVVSVVGWYNAAVRTGMFDSQNGIFFEFDGQTLYAVRRSSTQQISGFVSVNAGSSTVTGQTVNGVSTIFSKQLQPNDFIVIKGMSYRIVNIASDTSMTISPAYRGVANLTNAIVSKTVDLRIPQNLWNIDKCDGTGPSGFNMNLAKMQMFYMDYSWYGAGFIRWGFRGADGNVIYCHKLANNNYNNEAYMRSGNLPGRYETNTFSKYGILTQSAAGGDNVIYISDWSGWPTSGTAVIRNATQQEYINYTGVSQAATLTGTLTYGSSTIGMTSTSGVSTGQYVIGTGIPSGAYVISIATNSSVVLSVAVTATGSQTLYFGPSLTGVTRAQAGGALTFTLSTTSNVITGASTSGVQIGQYVTGVGIPQGTYVVSFVANTSVTLSQYPVSSGSQTVTFSPMGMSSGQTWTYSATAPIAVESHSPAFAPTISHWGTSVIMDGRFDDDKSFVFIQGMNTNISVNSGARNAIMSFRLSPSVSNGITGNQLGQREIVNRMQMVLRQMDLFSNGSFLIQLFLNGTTAYTSDSWTSVGGSSFAQYIIHFGGTTISGGEPIFGFYTNFATSAAAATQQDLNLVRDMGTSILSGGVSTGAIQVYPDGPDVVTIVATNIGASTGTIQARLSWTEAQA